MKIFSANGKKELLSCKDRLLNCKIATKKPRIFCGVRVEDRARTGDLQSHNLAL